MGSARWTALTHGDNNTHMPQSKESPHATPTHPLIHQILRQHGQRALLLAEHTYIHSIPPTHPPTHQVLRQDGQGALAAVPLLSQLPDLLHDLLLLPLDVWTWGGDICYMQINQSINLWGRQESPTVYVHVGSHMAFDIDSIPVLKP